MWTEQTENEKSYRQIMNIGTWNVQTISGKTALISEKGIENLKMDIIAQTKKRGLIAECQNIKEPKRELS